MIILHSIKGTPLLKYVFEPPGLTLIPVANSAQEFPVHRVYCVGKNYAAHVREMGLDPKRDPPCFFMKPADAIVTTGRIPYPPGTTNYHYEAELVIAIGKQGSNIHAEDVMSYIYGYAVGFDMTRRDLQISSGKLGYPWETGKGFDYSAPISPVYPLSEVGRIDSGRIALTVNGETRQDSDISDMIWKNHEIISELSRLFILQPGDLIFTGTPAGVGAVVPGDKLVASIEKLGEVAIEIVEPL